MAVTAVSYSPSHEALLHGTGLDAELALAKVVMAATLDELAGDILQPITTEHLATGGKLLRARLALATALRLGSGLQARLAWAAGCELMHNATLIHDDLQDGDEIRRGQPTVWKKHGVAQAINAGDLLFMVPYHLVTRPPFDAQTSAALCRVLAQWMTAVIVGQAAECAMTASQSGTLQDYLQMVRGKTAALFELPVIGAALCSGKSEDEARQFAAGFASLGVLFQLQDDVLDLYGDKGRNVRGSDIYEGKMSALVVEHLARCPTDSAWLLALLHAQRDCTSPTEVQRASAAFVASGALAAVLETINQEATAAKQAVHPLMEPLVVELSERIVKPIAEVQRVHGKKISSCSTLVGGCSQ